MKRLIFVTLLSTVTILSTAKALAQQDLQFKFRIPTPQELTHNDEDYVNEVEQREALISVISAMELKDSSFKSCPLFSELVFRISEDIIEANQLRNLFPPGSPIFKMESSCFHLLKGGRGPESGLNGVLLPAWLSISSSSEDEIAFIIAHEMSHIILQHYRWGPEYRKVKLTSESWSNQAGEGNQSEKEADGLGTILMANSDYDPRAAKESLCNTVRYLKDYPSYFPCLAVNSVPDSSHGSGRERYSRIERVLKQIRYEKSPARVISRRLQDARNESIAQANKLLLENNKSTK